MGANYVGIGRMQYHTWIYLSIMRDIGNVLDDMYICTYQDKTSRFWGRTPAPPISASLLTTLTVGKQDVNLKKNVTSIYMRRDE